MLRIAVCDDEKKCIEKISNLLKKAFRQYGISVYRIDTYDSGESFINANNSSYEYDVIFLDINMPDISGLEIAEKIRKGNPNILLVFVTAYIDFAVEGYRMEAIRYLLKDMLDEMFPECIEIIMKKLSLQAKKIKYHFLEGEKELSLDSIQYIESNMHKLIFHVLDKRQDRYSLYGKLDNIEAEFLEFQFLRIHKSFLVNPRYITGISNYKVYLESGKVLPVPREKFQRVKERFYEIQGDMI